MKKMLNFFTIWKENMCINPALTRKEKETAFEKIRKEMKDKKEK